MTYDLMNRRDTEAHHHSSISGSLNSIDIYLERGFTASKMNLGFAFYAAALNWGRSTLGVIPFVWIGAQHYGATGVIAGWALGAVVFGVTAVFLCFRVIASIEQRDRPDHDRLPGPPPTTHSPFSTGKAATLG